MGFLEIFRKRKKLEQSEADHWYEKATELLNSKSYDLSLLCINKSLEINPLSDAAWDLKGRIFFELGKNEDAIKCYDHAIRINPCHPISWAYKGLSLANLDNHDQALECLDKAIQLVPILPKFWLYKIDVLIRLGRYDEAFDICDKIIEMKSPIEEVDYKGKALILKADILEKLN